MAAAIEVNGVSKRFRLNHERHRTLKERAIHFGRRTESEPFWALQHIEFQVAEGETVGLLGHNGSGKSTLLKCIGGILQPTLGSIVTRGRVASLLELGAGFHPDLTGRENVYMNAQILGLKSRDIAARFDEIVEFAGLEDFIDEQVKHYSSGMYVRLGFAVATNVDPDILLIDEVLAVGDEAFQRKCLDRIREFQRAGKTLVFVTHSADLMRSICDRAVALDHGRVIASGLPGEAIRAFRMSLVDGRGRPSVETELDLIGEDEVEQAQIDAAALANREVAVVGVELSHPGDGERDYLLPGEALRVRVRYHAAHPIDDVVFVLNLHDTNGQFLFGVNTDSLMGGMKGVDGDGFVDFHLPAVPLLGGKFLVSIGVHSHDQRTIYDHRDGIGEFEVVNPGRAAGLLHIDATVSQATPEPTS